MVFTYNIDIKTTFIVVYQYVTKSVPTIHKYTKVPIPTIYDWISKLENNIDIMERQKGGGQAPKLTPELKSRIRRRARSNPNSSSTRRLASQFDISKTSASKVLKEGGFRYNLVPKSTKKLTEEEKENRVQYCRRMLKRKADCLYTTFFSDEMGINLSDAYQKKVWHPPNKKVKVSKPDRDVRLNCWGAVSAQGATSLHIFKGSLDRVKYQAILQEHKEEMEELYPNGYLFIHDNLRAHTAAENWAMENEINISEFPTYSPDLNIIENVWSALKQAVAVENPKTEAALARSLEENWALLTSKNALTPYFENLKVRYLECIDKGGTNLPY